MAQEKTALLLIMAAMLSGCMGQYMTPQAEVVMPRGLPRILLSPDALAAAETETAGTLKDPESARFFDLVAYQKPPSNIVVCGNVNAKNSLGGYVGKVPFVIELAPTGPNSYRMVDGLVADATNQGIQTFYSINPLCGP
jgi:hypothetical protein